jgi:hypothetical protein
MIRRTKEVFRDKIISVETTEAANPNDRPPNEKENGARGKWCDIDGKPEGCFRGKKTS